jgi:hypothetical protein
MWGALWREVGSVFYNCCWSSPAQSFSGPSPMGLATIVNCLRFETSLSVASYDSQGYGGGIRPSLQQFPYFLPSCICCRWSAFAKPFPSNGRLLYLCYAGFQQICHNIIRQFTSCRGRIPIGAPTILYFSLFFSGKCSNSILSTTASFHVLSKSLFADLPTIRRSSKCFIRFRHSSNMKVIASTFWEAAVLLLVTVG